jgi:hypothetical protein
MSVKCHGNPAATAADGFGAGDPNYIALWALDIRSQPQQNIRKFGENPLLLSQMSRIE